MRIDDTDRQRNVQAALQPILDGFRWLGLDWDEGPEADGPFAPYFQSQREELYRRAVQQLLASGHAYRDYSTTEELQQQRREAEKAGRTFVYDRRWMAADDQQAQAFAATGRSCVVRLKMPREGECVIQDGVRGEVSVQWASEQDHVIQRADGSCLYHLASVVDDHAMQITHVVRAEEHLPNTPRQVFIAQSLGYPLPQYAHLPYVAEPGGSAKLSKRKLTKYRKNKEFQALMEHGERIAKRVRTEISEETFNPVIVDFYREIGFLPDAILNYLLLLGWALDGEREHFSREEMIKHFSLERVNKSPASFDPQKLLAMEVDWMMQLQRKRKIALVLPYLQAAGLVADPPPCEIAGLIGGVLEAAGDRVKMAGDILDFDFMFVAATDMPYDANAAAKHLQANPAACELLTKFIARLDQIEPFDPATIETAFKSFCAEHEIKVGQLIGALRVATTGQAVGFSMFETLTLLGRTETAHRIAQSIKKFRN